MWKLRQDGERAWVTVEGFLKVRVFAEKVLRISLAKGMGDFGGGEGISGVVRGLRESLRRWDRGLLWRSGGKDHNIVFLGLILRVNIFALSQGGIPFFINR
ncbi:hypothetical protein L6452_21622 [Arctium lappa]|uniref:Uncharacterized protein n=1 Tax=Arctium lappa TaxID=4217 RepID=A0ACB9AX61_ARCLA|nr:hypothetical protein L6452_21622 [Arctium lappa]